MAELALTPPLVSVITPTRGRPDKLSRALESVLRQSLEHLEVLVVDDGRGEGLELATSLEDPRIRGSRIGGRGQVGARNAGLKAASGTYIALLDDDDWWEDPEHLTESVRRLEAEPGLVHQLGWIVFEDGRREDFCYLPQPADFRHYNQLLTSSVVYPRRFHDDFGPFDPLTGNYFDWDWYLRILHRGFPVSGIERQGICYTVDTSSLSGSLWKRRRRRAFQRFTVKHGLEIRMLNHLYMHRELQARLEGKAVVED